MTAVQIRNNIIKIKGDGLELWKQLYKHDHITFDHSYRVADLLYQFGSYINFPKLQLCELYEVGIFHDIGKLLIPKEVLNKDGKLTTRERNEIVNHTIYGYNLLKDIYPEHFLDCVLYHHENLDGSGYEKLKGEEIPFIAKILRIVDSFDAMTNNRSYQKAIPINSALAELERLTGKWYETSLVNSFVKMIKNDAMGTAPLVH